MVLLRRAAKPRRNRAEIQGGKAAPRLHQLFIVIGHEIAAKPTARTCRHAVMAQHGGEQHREIAAVADQPFVGRAGLIKRARVQLDDSIQLGCH
jgi:hypothetical protein